MTTLATVIAGAGAVVDINDNFVATGPAGMYGRRASTTTGLTWGYYGGRAFGNTVADGTVSLTASTTNYVVADRSTGAVSVATNTTNWDDSTDYLRLYLIVAGASTVSSFVDYREFLGGSSGGGGSTAWGDLTGVPAPIQDIAALTDPGADRILFWDDSAGEYRHLIVGSGLSIDDDTLEASGAGSGDVIGPGSSVDNALPRFDGTGGKTLQGSNVQVTDNDEISGYRGNINPQTGTTYTLDVAGADTDSGKVVECTNGSAITVTLPNSAPVGFCCTLLQGGAGQITVSAASGATLRNRQSHTKTAGQWAMLSLCVRTNSGGSSAEYVMAGDTAA